MTPPRHHPSDLTLFAYGSGGLGEALALTVATHLVLCAACRDRVAAIEALGGVLLDELEPQALAPTALERVMGRLETKVAAAPPRALARDTAGRPWPAPLQPYLQPAQRWRPLVPGIRQMKLLARGAAGGTALLAQVAPGSALSHHGHHGREMTVVLRGSFHDGSAQFRPGDFSECDEMHTHSPIADREGACVCVVAIEGRLRFTGLLGRLLQPLIGL